MLTDRPFRLWRKLPLRVYSSILLGCLAPAWIASEAQTTQPTFNTITIPADFNVGIMQASDGNFYTKTLGNSGQGCPNDPNDNDTCAAIYQVTPGGTETAFHQFQLVAGSGVYSINADGLQPTAFIEGTDGNFYGTCAVGGSSGFGTIFKIAPDGTFTKLYDFPGMVGTVPTNIIPIGGYEPAGLVQGSDGNLYGVTPGAQRLDSSGNPVGAGGLFFSITTAGVFTPIHYFTLAGSGVDEGTGANSIVQGDDGNFYVTMQSGPGANAGAIDQVTPSGNVTVLYSFPVDGSLGSSPQGPLVEDSAGYYYGAAVNGATGANPSSNTLGSAFKINSAENFILLHTFTSANAAQLNSAFILGSDGNFYGSTFNGGDLTNVTYCVAQGCGTIFQLQNTGVLTTLHEFEGGAATSYVVSQNPQVTGAGPSSPLVQTAGGIFYGTTEGGAASSGTVFTLGLATPIPAPVQLTFTPSAVAVGSSTTLNWKVLNAFSDTAQVCGAVIQGSPRGAGNWSGPQSGTLTDGVYSGSAVISPTVAATYTYALTCGGTETGFATLIVSAGFSITNSALPAGIVGTQYSQTVYATGGTEPFTWTVSGLPQGLSYTDSADSVLLSGIPEQFGVANVTISATDSSNPQKQATATLPLKIASSLKVVTTSVVKGTIDVQYADTVSATGGVAPYTWTLQSGTLPDGMSLLSNGTFVGTPTVSGKFPVTVQVQDSEGTPATATGTLTLNIVPSVQIAAVEFTQVIQQYQNLSDLQTTLMQTGEPPVPIVANRWSAMRVYFTKLKDATTVNVTATGAVASQLTLVVPPGCETVDQRSHSPTKSCPSMDFYFAAPAGTWSTQLTLTDQNGNQLEQENLTVTSRTTQGVNLKGVTACVAGAGTGCGNILELLVATGLTAQLWPAPYVLPVPTTQKITSTFSTVPTQAGVNNYENALAHRMDSYYSPADLAFDTANQTRTTYVTFVPTVFGTVGGDSVLPGHGLAISDYGAAKIGADYLPHEYGHTVNVHHTNTGDPHNDGNPGCYSIAPDPKSPWPFPNNYIQSGVGQSPSIYEYGFNATTGTVIDPLSNFDMMGYCGPSWIAPFDYKLAFPLLGGDVVASPSVRRRKAAQLAEPHAAQPPLTATSYWQVGGSIGPDGVTLDPIFTQTLLGVPSTDTGTYSVVALGSSGAALFTQPFTPETMQQDTFSTTAPAALDPVFTEWIPVTPDTAAIEVLDPTGNILSNIPLTGVAPTVTLSSPVAGFVGSGVQTLSWTAQSATATSFTSRVFYSTDSGTTWQPIDETTELSDTFDFSTLPGASAALIRVDVSDGVNTGTATSVPFSVPKKQPSTIVINTPADGAIQAAVHPVYLSGAAYDADDGILTGKALAWSDSIKGALGTGSPLTATLGAGAHTITLTATDSDGNSITATTQITLAGDPPVVTLTAPSSAASCVDAGISAVPGAQGADLTQVSYSLDGGMTYTSIPLTSLPIMLPVPGSGAINLVAIAVDASGQTGAANSELNLGNGCAATTLQANAGNTQSAVVGSAFATPLTALVVDFYGKPVAGATVTFSAPASGASATLSSATAVTNSSGLASVTATANATGGSYNVTASAANASATISFALTNSDFKIAAGAASVTVTPSAPGTDTITITSLGGFSGSVAFSCSGLPTDATCAFAPATVTATGSTAATTLTITVSQTATTLWTARAGTLLACCLIGFVARRRRGLSRLALVFIAAALAAGLLTLNGCGGSSGNQIKPSASNVTITATSGSLQRTTLINLDIQ